MCSVLCEAIAPDSAWCEQSRPHCDVSPLGNAALSLARARAHSHPNCALAVGKPAAAAAVTSATSAATRVVAVMVASAAIRRAYLGAARRDRSETCVFVGASFAGSLLNSDSRSLHGADVLIGSNTRLRALHRPRVVHSGLLRCHGVSRVALVAPLCGACVWCACADGQGVRGWRLLVSSVHAGRPHPRGCLQAPAAPPRRRRALGVHSARSRACPAHAKAALLRVQSSCGASAAV